MQQLLLCCNIAHLINATAATTQQVDKDQARTARKKLKVHVGRVDTVSRKCHKEKILARFRGTRSIQSAYIQSVEILQTNKTGYQNCQSSYRHIYSIILKVASNSR